MLGNIQVLNLQGNQIKNVEGIERLYSLEKLDLAKNKIATLADVSGLANLPELMQLNLRGNPIEKDGVKMSYRLKLLNLFKESRLDKSDKKTTYRDLLRMLPNINDTVVSNKELLALRNFTFSQSVATNGIEVDDSLAEGQSVQSKDPSVQLLEPFRDDYTGVDSSTNVLQPHGHRRTIRKTQRKKVSILDSSQKYNMMKKNPVRRKKPILDKKIKAGKLDSDNILNNYPTVENVIISMITPNKTQVDEVPQVHPHDQGVV